MNSMEQLRSIFYQSGWGMVLIGIVRFEKENLTFTGEDSPMSHLLLSVMGAFAQFERDLIRERQREGITLAKLPEGAYVGRKHSLTPAEAKELCRRVPSTFSTRCESGPIWRRSTLS